MKHADPNNINVDLNPFQFRQGDVLLLGGPSVALPAAATDITPDEGRVVLALGEATGHAHAFYERACVTLRQAPSRDRYLKVVKTTALLHEEHTAPKVPPGIYRLPKQVEYSPRELVRVAD
jgi:hypothetical protein